MLSDQSRLGTAGVRHRGGCVGSSFALRGSVTSSPTADAAQHPLRENRQSGNEPGANGGEAGPAISLPKTSESPRLLRIRHSMSHVLAMAVQKLLSLIHI